MARSYRHADRVVAVSEGVAADTRHLTGLTADICVQLTAMDAYIRGYRIRVPANCTAAESPERKEAALDYMGRVLKCDTAPL